MSPRAGWRNTSGGSKSSATSISLTTRRCGDGPQRAVCDLILCPPADSAWVRVPSRSGPLPRPPCLAKPKLQRRTASEFTPQRRLLIGHAVTRQQQSSRLHHVPVRRRLRVLQPLQHETLLISDRHRRRSHRHSTKVIPGIKNYRFIHRQNASNARRDGREALEQIFPRPEVGDRRA